MIGFIKNVFNFNSIGTKIKMAAAWSCWIEIVVIWLIAAVGSVYMFFFYLEENLFFALIASAVPVLAALVASFLTWISYWLMYAVGDIVESSSENLRVNYESYLTLKSIEAKLTDKTTAGSNLLESWEEV